MPASDVIYLDHAATTPLDPVVFEAMVPYLTEHYGNPSSIYQLGQTARAGIDRSRATVARILGCHPSEVLFTSGATESNNLALNGVAWARRLGAPSGPAPHVVTTAIEHHAVLHTAQWLERIGFSVSYVSCDATGIVSADAISAAIRPETCLISVMYANNEVGAIQPIAEIAAEARRHGIPLHVDAVQAPGLLPLDVRALGADLMSLSAHKFYGPKGVGVLHVRKGTAIAWQQHGGSQEGGRRGGTENVAGIVGLGVALERADAARDAYAEHCRTHRDMLWEGISERVPHLSLNGPSLDGPRLASNLNMTFHDVQGETVLLSLDMQGVAASAGSACTTGKAEPSHVLLAAGLTEPDARASLRLTVGRQTNADEIEQAVAIVAETIARVRGLAGVR